MTNEQKHNSPEQDALSEFERQRKMKVTLLAAVGACLVGALIWWMFRPAPVADGTGLNSINTTVPDGKAQATVGDKQKAAEQIRSVEEQHRRMQSLGDNTFSLLDDGSKATAEVDATDNPALRAAEANRSMQTQVRQFYAQPARNAEIETLKEQVETLQAQLDAERQRPDPLQLAEEQYKLARKYLGSSHADEESANAEAETHKNRLSVMRPVREGDVEASTLNPEMDFTRERNLGFLTAAGRTAETNVPTVQACIAATQVVRAGSMVHLRLLDAVRIDGVTIPRNTMIHGTAVITGMRLQVEITSIEYEGHIFTVEASAYDMDGQPGLNIPDSKERTALKEALASIGQTAGTSINVTHSTGQAVLSELARGGLQASSRYVSEKLREVKITLKANHRVLLISKEQ